MRMKQYLTHTNYSLWEVIVNGDAPAIASASTKGPIPPKTAKQKLARKNELKAKSTLLLAIPNEHLLKFHGIKDAKTIWEAIKTRFGGNKESKKMQKTILKQQYKNFTASRSEGLDKTYDRSLPLAWNNIALIMRNKSDLDTMSMDDLYNNLKVYEAEIKSQSSSSSNSQNVAFVSSENTSSTNEAVNTAYEVSTANSQGQASTLTYVDDVMFSFFTTQSNSPQLDNEDLEQIDTDDLEEMDLKWQVVMLTMRVKRFLKKTRRNLNFNGKETVGFDKIKVKCYNCHMRGYFAREYRAPRNRGNRNGDVPRRIVPVETPANALVVQDGIVHQVQTLRFKKVKGYHAVPLPYTRNYMPSRPDLSFAGLDDSVYKTNVSETITSVPRNESTASKSSKDNLEQPKDVRPSAPIIEDWESDSDDDCVFRPSAVQTKLKFINFVKSGEHVKLVNKENTPRQEEYPRKSQSPRSNRRNLNGIMTQKLGDGFEFKKKTCFVCGSVNHLIKDCNFLRIKWLENHVFNNKGKGYWSKGILTKSGNVPVNTAKQSFPRAEVSNSTARYVNTVLASSDQLFNNVTTAGPKAVVSAAKGNRENAVKSSTCWIWRPKENVIDHISIDSGSYTPKRFDSS
ncbi:hypothetical protein Tco_0660687 [Tanacetum coccineum]